MSSQISRSGECVQKSKMAAPWSFPPFKPQQSGSHQISKCPEQSRVSSSLPFVKESLLIFLFLMYSYFVSNVGQRRIGSLYVILYCRVQLAHLHFPFISDLSSSRPVKHYQDRLVMAHQSSDKENIKPSSCDSVSLARRKFSSSKSSGLEIMRDQQTSLSSGPDFSFSSSSNIWKNHVERLMDEKTGAAPTPTPPGLHVPVRLHASNLPYSYRSVSTSDQA